MSPILRRFDITTYKGTGNQQPATNALITLRRQGATANLGAPVTITPNQQATINVFDTGTLVPNDTLTVQLNPLSATHKLTVISMPSTTQLVLKNIGSSNVTINNLDRLLDHTNQPIVYADPAGSSQLGSTLTADTIGRTAGYIREKRFDYTITGNITPSSRLYPDAMLPTHAVSATDYLSIQAAIDALPSDGGLVFFPSGTYLTTDTIHINKRNVHLVGEAPGTPIIKPSLPTYNYHIMSVEYAGFTCENLVFDGLATVAGGVDILQLNGVGSPTNHSLQPATIRNCFFGTAKRYGLFINGGVFGVHIVDCFFNYCKTNPVYATKDYPVALNLPTHVRFQACSFDANDGPVVLDGCSGFTFQECLFEGNKGGQGVNDANSVHVKNSLQTRFYDCHTELPETGLLGPVTALWNFETATEPTIVGCIWNGSATASAQPNKAVFFQTTRNAVIINPRLENIKSGGLGFHFDPNSQGAVVSNGGYGLDIYDQHSDDFAGQTLSIAERSLLAQPQRGIYLVTFIAYCTVAEAGVTLDIDLKWRDELGMNTDHVVVAFPLSSTGKTSVQRLIHPGGSPQTDIAWLTSKNGGVGSAVYSVYARAIRM